MITIYGIKNCDTVRAALKWATEKKIQHQFHDFRKSPLPESTICEWLDAVGHTVLVNKRGTTYRKLDGADKALLEGTDAVPLLTENPTLMKRPIFKIDDTYVVGFSEKEKSKLLELV